MLFPPLFVLLLLPLPSALPASLPLFSDPSLVASTSGSLRRVSSALRDALQLEGALNATDAASLQLLLPELQAALLFGSARAIPLPGTPATLLLRPAATQLGGLLRGLRCEAGWGEGCGGSSGTNGGGEGGLAAAEAEEESAEATLRLRVALWRRRHEFCEFADVLAPGALSLRAPRGWAPLASLAGGRGGRVDVGGADTAAGALAACVLRRLRNAGAGVARVGGGGGGRACCCRRRGRSR